MRRRAGRVSAERRPLLNGVGYQDVERDREFGTEDANLIGRADAIVDAGRDPLARTIRDHLEVSQVWDDANARPSPVAVGPS